jgi:ribosome recycling factor
MALDNRLQQFKVKMELSSETFVRELSGIRAGRASVALLEPIKVEAYGSLLPMSQVGTISAPDARMLTVSVWDRDVVKNVEVAIRESGANLNPTVEGQTVRVPIPPLSDERRRELSKLAAKYAEDAKVAIRNIRREAMEYVKHIEKSDGLGEDEAKRLSEAVQELTDNASKQIDTHLAAKQHDIMQI